MFIRSIVPMMVVLGLAACAAPGDTASQGVLDVRKPPVSLTPVRLVELDGKNLVGQPAKTSYWIDAGEHEIVLAAAIDAGEGISSVGGGPHQNPGRTTIEIEAGKRYYIAAERTGSRTDEWQPVIYKVDDL